MYEEIRTGKVGQMREEELKEMGVGGSDGK